MKTYTIKLTDDIAKLLEELLQSKKKSDPDFWGDETIEDFISFQVFKCVEGIAK